MKKDIPQKKVLDLAISVVPRDGDLWDVYVINLKDEPIKNVLINSKGYGIIDDEKVETTVLRHFFPSIGPLQLHKIEPITKEVLVLTNEYWVSFNHNDYMFDKKYVFVKGSIDPMNFTLIPFLNEQGVMIR